MSLEVAAHELRREGKNAKLRVTFTNKLYVLMDYRERPGGIYYCEFTVFRTGWGLYTYGLT